MKRLCLVIISVLLLLSCKKDPAKLKAYDNKLVLDLPNAYLIGYKNLDSTNEMFKQGTLELLDDLYIDGQPFVFYMGFAGCPYCQDLAPALLDVAREYDVPVVYIDVDALWDDFEAPIGETIKNTYYKELELDDDGEKAFFFPFVVFVKNQKVLFSNIGTVASHDAHKGPLNEKETQKLKNLLGKGFTKLLSD